MHASAAHGACQARQDLAAAAGTFARSVDGHLGTAATSRPVTPRRIIGLHRSSIEDITLSDGGRQNERWPIRIRSGRQPDRWPGYRHRARTGHYECLIGSLDAARRASGRLDEPAGQVSGRSAARMRGNVDGRPPTASPCVVAVFLGRCCLPLDAFAAHRRRRWRSGHSSGSASGALPAWAIRSWSW